MEPTQEFAVTVANSKDGQEWNTISVGHWTPPSEPHLTGDVLPDSVLEKLREIGLRVSVEGGAHNIRYGDWYYRFDLLRKAI